MKRTSFGESSTEERENRWKFEKKITVCDELAHDYDDFKVRRKAGRYISIDRLLRA